MVIDDKKKCPQCGEDKLAEGNFYRVKRNCGDGFAGYCIACTKAKVVKWQKANPEKKKASDAKQQARPERREPRNAVRREWQHNNRDKMNLYAQRMRDKNPEKARSRYRKWRETNPDKVATAQRRYHSTAEWKAYHAQRERWRRAMAPAKYRESERGARRRGVSDIAVTFEQWQGIMLVFDHRCAYCGEASTAVDHFTPVNAGGRHVTGNLVPACKSCNSAKNDSDPFDWMDRRGIDSDAVVAKLHETYAVTHAA